MLWEIDISPAAGQPDRLAQQLIDAAAELEVATNLPVVAAIGYLIQGDLQREQVERLARELFADPVTQTFLVASLGEEVLNNPPQAGTATTLIQVMPKPGVMDPVAQSAAAAIAELGLSVDAVSTLRKYWLAKLSHEQLELLVNKALANPLVEQTVFGPLTLERLSLGSGYQFNLLTVPLRTMDAAALATLSRERLLHLSPHEMQAIQRQYQQLGRDPTDLELETLAQTWSEHCCHKTLTGPVAYTGPLGDGKTSGSRQFQNLLQETIFAATEKIRTAWRQQGVDDWCLSVFDDNAGVVGFDEQYHLAIKVETHNHPAALEPYGGASTGMGGVIRDVLAAGLGAKPVAATDVFCFAPPDTPRDSLPSGVLSPRRIMNGIVAGVRDYANRVGVPTVNGAIYFDPRYLANPLVYCGCVGLLPADKLHKEIQPGDFVVVVGGRTGRDGIHGATFSSVELGNDNPNTSGAVQIGNAIAEKMLLDVLLASRDKKLYRSITDCGAGGLSSAVGEMAKHLGAIVHLDKAPLKYAGLSYAEIWISESQERMVLAAPPDRWPELEASCRNAGVTAAAIGEFSSTGRLQLFYQHEQVGDLPLDFLHQGRPSEVREAICPASESDELRPVSAESQPNKSAKPNYHTALVDILSSLNVCSREAVIRQYDHEVQGGSVVKPLVGLHNDGPSDAAVLRPVLTSRRGLVLACGMNPRYGDLDPYRMAASAIDEAVRNCVAVGADPNRIALVDNFCWGDCRRPEVFGSLVRTAMACHDVAIGLGTPFVSGKDSLNNEFHSADAAGNPQRTTVPPSLLITALGQLDDVGRCVTMDLKRAGNMLYQVGCTNCELGGSHFALIAGLTGGAVPHVNTAAAKATFAALHKAIHAGYVRACHDLSEGGLAVAAAEMAFAGGSGARLYLLEVPHQIASVEAAQVPGSLVTALLFSESNSRFLVEVPAEAVGHFEEAMGNVPHAAVGEVIQSPQLIVADIDPMAEQHVIDIDLATLKEAWQKPLRNLKPEIRN